MCATSRRSEQNITPLASLPSQPPSASLPRGGKAKLPLPGKKKKKKND